MPWRIFTSGEVLTAENVMTYLARQAKAVITSTTRPGSPTLGQEIYESDSGISRRWSGSSWVTWPPTALTFGDLGNFNVTATEYILGSNQVSGTFTVGPTGKALITVGGAMQGASDGGIIYLSFEIKRTDESGTQYLAPADANAFEVQGGSGQVNVQGSYTTLVTGMQPYQQYFARLQHRSGTGGTCSIFGRRLIVQPLAN